MSQKSILQVKEISKKYDSEAILDQLSFEVREGEFLAIVGESGTGKSSLLRIMSGYLDADFGKVIFDEETIKGPAARLVPGYEEIQLVHQQFDLHPYMSAEENIKRPLLGFAKDYQKEKLDELLKLSGLQDKPDKKPHELSGGQQQKLAIATALAVEPAVLLLDEPFSNLDPFSKQVFLRQIKQQTQQLGTTAVFVTHDTRDALAVADRIIVLSEGKIAQQGTPQEVYSHPLSESIARFFGPVNVFTPKEWSTIFDEKIDTKVGVRPESILWSSTKKGTSAVVREVLFGGESTHFLVDVPAKKIGLEIQAGGVIPEIGSQIFISIDMESAMVMK